MDQNDTEIQKVNRLIYTKEVLNSLRNSALSLVWPENLDKNCVNSHGQWDPVKSFDGVKPTETKRGSLYEPKTFKNNDKNKDDISLRPERRKWNDGCQVSNNKRNSDDSHSSSYRKTYQGSTLNNGGGGGDYDRRTFNRTANRSVKQRDADKEAKYHNPKTEKSSRNNSNLDERKDDKDEHVFNYKNCNINEPEWFSNGPENCDEIIELRGITANDSSIINFKKDSSKNETKYEVNGATNEININFTQDSPVFVETSCITSPKREGSRFQDIFQKETKNNNLKESKDVENIIKAVLSDTVSKSDAEKLNNVSKPLPNGVLTVEEIEKGIKLSPIDIKRIPSKSTIDTLTSFEPSLNSLLSSGVSSPSIDNSKVVNWLSNLNMNIKEPEIEHKSFYPDSPQSFNNMMAPQPMFTPVGYSKFVPPSLQHPPGLPLMMNSGHLPQSLQQQQQLQHQQLLFQQQQQQLSMLQQQQNHKHVAYMKQLSLGQPSNLNNMSQRNPLLAANIQHEGFLTDKYKLNSQQSLPNDLNMDQSVISSFLMKNNMQMNHINDRGNMVALTNNGPPGLTNMNMSRPIVKTNPPPFMDLAQMNDLSHQQYQNNYRRPIYADTPTVVNNCKPMAQFNQLEMYKNMHSRDNNMMQPNMSLNNYQSQQAGLHYDNALAQRSSSNKMLANLFNVNSSYLPPLPQQAKYADQIETENIK